MKMPEEFPVKDALKLSDSDLGRFVMAWHIGEQAEELGIPVNQIPHDVATAIVHQTLTMKVTTAKQAALVEVLRRAAEHDFEGAGKIMREFLTDGIIHVAALDEAVTGKRRQRENAKKSRADGLQILIEKIVSARPDVKPSNLVNELRTHIGGNVVESIDEAEGTIEWRDENNPAGTAPISGLKDRLSRARKKLASR